MQWSMPSPPHFWSLGATLRAAEERPAAVSCHCPPLSPLPAALLAGAELGTSRESWEGSMVSWQGRGARLVLSGEGREGGELRLGEEEEQHAAASPSPTMTGEKKADC